MPALRTEVDYVVGTFYYLHVVLYNDYRVSSLYERLERVEQFLYIVEMQSGCRFVENKKGGLAFFQPEIVGQLDALVFSA